MTITITSVNDVPDAVDDTATIVRDAAATAVGVLGNDTDTEHDTLHITGKTNGAKGTVAITGGGTGLTYDPFTGLSGADSFIYTIDDGNGGTDTATVFVTIAGANLAPNAANDVSFSVPEGAAATRWRSSRTTTIPTATRSPSSRRPTALTARSPSPVAGPV